MMALKLEFRQIYRRHKRHRGQSFASFADAVDTTLKLLTAKIRGQKVAERNFPDLRESYLRLASSGDPRLERYALTNVEADRMTNSLNTLREQVFAWKRLSR
jgi:hypothetical protein